MLNCLNTTFTFGKKAKHNFINKKFRCRPIHAHSFFQFRARVTFGESRGCSSPRKARNTSRSTAISDSFNIAGICSIRWSGLTFWALWI